MLNDNKSMTDNFCFDIGKTTEHLSGGGGGELLLEILGGGVSPGSPNSDPISDQKT